MTFAVVLARDAKNPGVLNATVPVLPGCKAIGRGEKDALSNAELAIRSHFKKLSKTFPKLPGKVKCQGFSEHDFDAMMRGRFE